MTILSRYSPSLEKLARPLSPFARKTRDMSIDIKYQAVATAIGGRDGRAYSEDSTLDLKLSTPRELGGAGGEGTNPEQLFATGYAACFLSALHLVGRREKVNLPAETSVRATVGIGPNGSGGYGLAVTLFADVPGVNRTVAEHLVTSAHQVCPYSNAIRNNVPVELKIA